MRRRAALGALAVLLLAALQAGIAVPAHAAVEHAGSLAFVRQVPRGANPGMPRGAVASTSTMFMSRASRRC